MTKEVSATQLSVNAKHFAVMLDMVRHGIEYALIVEDDATFESPEQLFKAMSFNETLTRYVEPHLPTKAQKPAQFPEWGLFESVGGEVSVGANARDDDVNKGLIPEKKSQEEYLFDHLALGACEESHHRKKVATPFSKGGHVGVADRSCARCLLAYVSSLSGATRLLSKQALPWVGPMENQMNWASSSKASENRPLDCLWVDPPVVWEAPGNEGDGLEDAARLERHRERLKPYINDVDLLIASPSRRNDQEDDDDGASVVALPVSSKEEAEDAKINAETDDDGGLIFDGGTLAKNSQKLFLRNKTSFEEAPDDSITISRRSVCVRAPAKYVAEDFRSATPMDSPCVLAKPGLPLSKACPRSSWIEHHVYSFLADSALSQFQQCKKKIYLDLGFSASSMAWALAKYPLAFDEVHAWDSSKTHRFPPLPSDFKGRPLPPLIMVYNARADGVNGDCERTPDSEGRRSASYGGSRCVGSMACRQKQQLLSDFSCCGAMDISAYLQSVATKDDFVLFKIDVDGGMEFKIFDDLIRSGAWKLVDEVLVEFHFTDAEDSSSESSSRRAMTIEDAVRVVEDWRNHRTPAFHIWAD